MQSLHDKGGTCSGVAYLLLSLLLMPWTILLSLSRLTVVDKTVVANAGSKSMTEISNRRLTGLRLVLLSLSSASSLLRLIRSKVRGICLSGFLPPLITTLFSFHSLMLSQPLLISPLSLLPSFAHKHTPTEIVLLRKQCHRDFYKNTHTYWVQTGNT